MQAHTIGGGDRPELKVVELGATVVLLRPFSPDAEGHRADVVLGHPDLAGYRARPTTAPR